MKIKENSPKIINTERSRKQNFIKNDLLVLLTSKFQQNL